MLFVIKRKEKKKEKAFSLTIFFQVGPSLFSGAENTLDTKRQVQDRPTKAAEPVALLQIQQRNQPEQYVNRKMTFFHSASKKKWNTSSFPNLNGDVRTLENKKNNST